jgi:hypothetical protein
MPKTKPSKRRGGSVPYTDEKLRAALPDKKGSVYLGDALGCAAEIRIVSSIPATPQVAPGPDTKVVTAQTITASPAAESRIGQILLCQPTYGAPVAASQRAFWVGHSLPGGLAYNRCRGTTSVANGGSLLAKNFNEFWAMALNAREEGHDLTHFAMLHDDVVPEDGWLDKLLEDQLSSGADLVSAVIPIKDQRGMISTILYNKDSGVHQLFTNPAGTVNSGISIGSRATVSITVSDLSRLPPVFTAADCGYPEMRLLVNTGCWICRLDRDWVNAKNDDGSLKVFFTIRDRIAKKDGKWRADVWPEDYNFSLMVQENGGTVAATRRIGLYHEGEGAWHLPGIPGAA